MLQQTNPTTKVMTTALVTLSQTVQTPATVNQDPMRPEHIEQEAVYQETITQTIQRICSRIPPLWDLPNYVAVNPFVGFTATPVADAVQVIRDGLGGRFYPTAAYYRTRWQEGAFGRAELDRAAQRAGQSADLLKEILVGGAAMPMRPVYPLLTFAERHDRAHGSQWQNSLTRHAARWCEVYVPEGQKRWRRSEPQSLYAAWQEAAQVDRSLEIAGLAGWRAWVRQLPTAADQAIVAMLKRLNVAPEEHERYLYRLLRGVVGWASYLRRTTWSAGTDAPGALLDLLAIRICSDAAIVHCAPRDVGSASTPVADTPAETAVEDETILGIFQDALEDGYLYRLVQVIGAPAAQPRAARPAVQAAFCIDVRSEVLRRHLEAEDPAIQTIGFAGFFGVSVEWQANGTSSARCPVLLQPTLPLKSLAPAPDNVTSVVKAIQQTPAAFSYVELLGLFYGLTLVGDAFHWRRTKSSDEGSAPFTLQPTIHGSGVPLADRVATAANILKNIGLRATFARLVLFCGHGSSSENNAHAASLDCGACGGHSGAINSRVAAMLLNDPDVRHGLEALGWTIPADTCFVPALHDTTIDVVTLLDAEQIPASHQAELCQLERWLAEAGAGVRSERAIKLGLKKQPRRIVDRLLKRRAHDWAEVRPEWALARNAAFIAARRERTRGVNLEGRTFLHDYDWTIDQDNSILTLILSAPMVVASWINLQYFASTVDNAHFGCGTKALHNRVGSTGVVLGNGGDLQTGLALQSVQAPDGRWYHEPLRLQVIVEAPCQRIEAVFDTNPDVRNLVDNGWVRLFALDDESNHLQRWAPGVGWQASE